MKETNLNKTQPRILIVEDIPLALKMAMMVMTKFNFIIDTANTGAEAIVQYSNNDYSFILLDIGLPDTDGYKVTEIIREMEKQKNSHTPIIALTAHHNRETKDKALGSGMDDFLFKPLDADKARTIVDKYIFQSSLKTVLLPENYNYLALDNTEIRLLMNQLGHGSLAHGSMRPHSISAAITHKTVSESWFILSGTGKIWRQFDKQERVDDLKPNMIVDIPCGVEYQFANDAEPLVFLIVTMPPWPGNDETVQLADQNWQERLQKIPVSTTEGNAPLTIKSVPLNYQHQSPAGAEIRLLNHNVLGDVVHCTLKANIISQGVTHKTVSEFWYVLSGQGQIWRKNGNKESVTQLYQDVCINIPLGTEFQYRADQDDLVFICVTMPPWSGADEARYIDNPHWEPSVDNASY